jgi:membrane dipeptidase
MAYAETADQVEAAAMAEGRIASLLGDGGRVFDRHRILGVLRQLYAMGARYMTLTHNSQHPLGRQRQPMSRRHGGLTDFGQAMWCAR